MDRTVVLAPLYRTTVRVSRKESSNLRAFQTFNNRAVDEAVDSGGENVENSLAELSQKLFDRLTDGDFAG